jgi:hypothetical protein
MDIKLVLNYLHSLNVNPSNKFQVSEDSNNSCNQMNILTTQTIDHKPFSENVLSTQLALALLHIPSGPYLFLLQLHSS